LMRSYDLFVLFGEGGNRNPPRPSRTPSRIT
jgi:hypothetical protein